MKYDLKATAFMRRMSVDHLVEKLDRLLEQQAAFVRVTGEISAFTAAASGHWYFNLKGEHYLIRCVVFRQQTFLVNIKPYNGLQIEVEAFVGLYRPRGELQLQVRMLHFVGDGALHQAYLELRNRLTLEGLFDPAQKKTIPRYPSQVGVITSLSAAALQDVLKILRQYAPHINVILYPAAVQGSAAASALIAALNEAVSHDQVELIMIIRGGGSMEELWCFNDEALVRAIVSCPLPTISGIGHETDMTLTDFAADEYAPTPTAAAYRLPAKASLQTSLNAAKQSMSQRMIQRLNTDQQQLDFAARILKSLRRILGENQLQQWKEKLSISWKARLYHEQQTMDRWKAHLSLILRNRVSGERQHCKHYQDLLKAYNPATAQHQGYVMIQTIDTQGHTQLIESVQQVSVGDKICALFKDGLAYANVTERTDQKPLTPLAISSALETKTLSGASPISDSPLAKSRLNITKKPHLS